MRETRGTREGLREGALELRIMSERYTILFLFEGMSQGTEEDLMRLSACY